MDHLRGRNSIRPGTLAFEHIRTFITKVAMPSSLRHTCIDCGFTRQEIQSVPTVDPEACPHLNTDNRGSSKASIRTYGKDCGTYVHVLSRTVCKQIKDETPEVSKKRKLSWIEYLIIPKSRRLKSRKQLKFRIKRQTNLRNETCSSIVLIEVSTYF